MTEKDLMHKLWDLQNHLHDRTARPEDILIELRNALEECGKRNEYPELWDNYKTSDELEELAKEALEAGLDRLYYFLGGVDYHDISIMYVDNYGNCDHRIWYNDLFEVIEGIVEQIEQEQGESINYKELGSILSDKLNELAEKDGYFDK